MLRTHTNNDLTKKHINKEATLCGWVMSPRDHGGIIFIDLRDRYGMTQVVFDPEVNKKIHKEAEKLRREDVIQVTGKVKERKKGMKNPNLSTGEIELFVSKLSILSKAEMPPIEVDDHHISNEATRMKYRYLDLRRPGMQKHLIIRHKAAQATREYLNSNNFLEIETPLLLKHTPEGARDYIVPSRVHPGKVYSLPQSPQLYKQMLMIAGFDRYYQLPKCLRDEDLREDRQPEFTQIDLEMSFVEEEDVMQMCEGLIKSIWKKAINHPVKLPFQRMTYDTAMDKYGTDRPDLRFGLELTDVTKIVKESDFKVFRDTIKKGGIVKCVNAEQSNLSRNQIDDYIAFAQHHGAAGLAWMKVTKKGLESNIVKFFSAKLQKQLLKETKAKSGDILMFIADKPGKSNDILSRIRLKLGHDLKLIKNELQFVWITDFPLLTWNEESQRWDAEHHPFTSPKEEHIPYLIKDPAKVKARAYDLVLNGSELGGGSIRINKTDVQDLVLQALKYSPKDAHEKFGFFLEALKYGTPPHGGIAFGFDRICALLCGFYDIREVIAFPKSKAAENPMDGSPSPWDDEYLKDLHLELDSVAKKNLQK